MIEKKFILAVLSFLLFSDIFAESFRVKALHSVEIQESTDFEYSFHSGINDATALFLPEKIVFMEGIELKITVPTSVAQWRDSVVFSIYDSIQPKPKTSQIDYSGTKVFVNPVPTKLSWNILIPISEKNSIKDGLYNSTKVNIIPDLKNKFIFFRLQPAMKGIPEEIFASEFKISVKPILQNKGNLFLNLSTFDNSKNPYLIFIDEKQIPSDKKNILLETGLHTLNIQSEFYRNETRSIYIEQAKNTDFELVLQSIEPTLKITAPVNTIIHIDEELYKPQENDKPVFIEQGEHKLRFQIGDYEILRPILVEKGKSYNINLKVDLQITEE